MADEMVSVGKPIPRIKSVGIVGVGRRAVEVVWANGTIDVVDLMPAFASHRGFVRLRSDDVLFQTIKVGEYGSYLEWDDGSELSSVWIEQLAESSLGNDEFREAMDRLQISLDGMAARLGVARRLIADYRKNKPIPPSIALATRYLLEQRKAG